ncbi:MAG: DNA polymerase III subunit beta [Candidatus Deferrimicrobiaceae bacterium]
MNFTVDRDQFEGILARIQGVAERRHTMPILSHTLLNAGPKAGPTGSPGLTLVASDLEIVVRCSQSLDVIEPGSVALPARKLFDIAKVLPKGPVTVAGREGNYVEISAGRGHFRLAGLGSEEFPEMPERPKGKHVPVDSETFRKLVDRVSAFATGDETRYNLSGILLERQEEEGKTILRMVATDGHRLAIADEEVPNLGGLLGERRVLVPRKGLIEIRKLSDGGPGSLELSATDKFLFAGKGDTEVWVRLLDAEFPDYRQVMPKENRIVASVPRGTFLEVLKRVSVMAPDKVNSVKLSFSGKQLEVSTTSPDLGEARDLLPIEFEGEPVKVGFNGRYLQDALGGISEDTVRIELKDEVSQVIVRPATDKNYLAIIMPMRIL